MSETERLVWAYSLMGALYLLGMACFGAAFYMERGRIDQALHMTGWRLRSTIALAILFWWIPALMMIWGDLKKWRTARREHHGV